MTTLLTAFNAGQSGVGAIEYGMFVAFVAIGLMFVVETIRRFGT